MNIRLVTDIVYNATLLLAIGVIYVSPFSRNFNRFSSKSNFVKIVTGLIIGFIGILIMFNPFELIQGVVFDTRTVLISVTGMFFGIIPTVIAVLITTIYRIMLGGAGVYMGVATIIVSAAIGLLWKYLRYDKGKILKNNLLEVYLAGLAVHVGMLLCTLLLPSSIIYDTFKDIAIPVLLIYPAAVLLLSALLMKQYDKQTIMLKLEQSENELNESHQLYEKLFSNMFDAFAMIEGVYDEKGQLTDFRKIKSNAIYDETFNQNEEQPQLNCQYNDADCFRRYKHVLETGQSETYTFFCIKTGKYFNVSVYVIGENLLATIHKDITKRTEYEKEVAKFKTIFDQSVVGNAISDLQGNLVYINKYFANLLGSSQEELKGTPFSAFYSENQEEVVLKMIDQLNTEGHFNATEIMVTSKNKKEIPMIMVGVMIKEEGVPAFMAVTARDLTERKKLEKEKQQLDAKLSQQQRLESIGTLAGGVAHEINNPINGIMNYAQLIIDDADSASKQAMYGQEILFESKRISEIVRNLLQFSRYDKQEHSYARIEDIISQTLTLIRTIIKQDQITLEVTIPEGLPDIKCRSQQIQQVLMNMMTNARDTLNEKYPGYHEDKIMRLTCEKYVEDGRNWLRLIVEDHGNGIREEIQEKIFEPFFTTKERDVGTGLGLPISYGIIKNHHGKLNYETEEGKFTRFYLDLPFDNGWDHETDL
ncbi:MAG: PAS domain S-box protein [Clostridia bacterium]|nr:PAS domain S-box protein [Clostridia bacterium]